MGDKLLNMNYDNLRSVTKDTRFPKDAGFQKMQATFDREDGRTITIHYQYKRQRPKP